MRIDAEGKRFLLDLIEGHERNATPHKLGDDLSGNLERFEVVDENVPPIGRELCNEMLQFWADHKPRLFIPGECEPEEGRLIIFAVIDDPEVNATWHSFQNEIGRSQVYEKGSFDHISCPVVWFYAPPVEVPE